MSGAFLLLWISHPLSASLREGGELVAAFALTVFASVIAGVICHLVCKWLDKKLDDNSTHRDPE
jgi:hypothetical protein